MTAAPNFQWRAVRAENILAAGVAIVCLLALLLLAMLWRGEQLRQETAQAISITRAMREDMLATLQFAAEAVSTERGARAAHERAIDNMRERAANLLRLSAADPEAHAAAARFSGLAELSLAPDRPAEDIHAALRASARELGERFNATIDISRARETALRLQLMLISALLAGLVLASAGLAALALRRERAHWRLAHQAGEEARARTAASDQAKTRFFAVASHDMRQPLHALTLYLHALERRVETQEARDIITKMERATASMVGMFASLLDVARIQGGVKAEISIFPLQDLLDRIVAENPDGSVEAAPVSLYVRTDLALLDRVIRNLISNARRHGGGKARIEVAAFERHVEISVADDGPGIAEQDQERIFDEFVRLDDRSGGEGLGLGLHLVKFITNALNMRLAVQSELGKGARFSFRVPRAMSPTGESSGDGAVESLAKAQVLVIDDNPLVCEAMANVLRDLDGDVRAGASEADANAAIEEGFKPALVIMDLRIDGELRGIDIARRLCARLQPPPRVIVVTGDTATETLAMLRASGYAWLIKPVDPHDLSATATAQLRAA